MQDAVAVPVVTRKVEWRIHSGVVTMTVVRLVLGSWMLMYASAKIFGFQAQVTPWAYAQPLGHTGGGWLIWAVLGYSPWFQHLVGWLEAIPSLLLLWARTRRLGALLMLPMTSNVVCFNFALNLWHETKVISTFFLVLNVLLIIYDLPVFISFLRTLTTPPVQTRSHKAQRRLSLLGSVLALFVVVSVFSFAFYVDRSFVSAASDFTGRRQINGAGSWRVEQWSRAGAELPVPPETIALFGFDQGCQIGALPKPSEGTFAVDRTQHTFTLKKVSFAGSSGEYKGTYLADGSHLQLKGTRDNQPLVVVLRRDDTVVGH